MIEFKNFYNFSKFGSTDSYRFDDALETSMKELNEFIKQNNIQKENIINITVNKDIDDDGYTDVYLTLFYTK